MLIEAPFSVKVSPLFDLNKSLFDDTLTAALSTTILLEFIGVG